MNTRRIHSRLLLALLLLAAGLAGIMTPQTAAADENGPIGSSGLNYSYTTADKTLTITGSGDMPDFGFLDHQPWDAFQTQIETVTIGAGVTSVGENAFLGCTALKSVTLPAGLQTLGESAFSGCDALTRIELPASLETIGVNALDGGSLTEIKVQTGNTHFEAEDGVLYNKGKTALLHYPCKKPGATFAVPASVTTIEVYAFRECAALENITLPDALETIENFAFSECTALKSVTIPKKVGTIGDFAFQLCTGLKDVTVLWNTPLTIPPGVFAAITPPTGVTLHVPGGTGEAYQGNAVWGELTIEELPWGDFDTGLHWAYDDATHTLTITNPTPGSPKPIPDFADQDKQPWKAYRGDIQKVTIGAGVTSVGQNAFLGCTALKSVTLPAGLKTLGESAFTDCDALTSIELPASLETIGTDALYAGGLTEIKVQTGNTHFEAEDGVLYNKGQTALLLYPRKKPGTTFAVPASVTTIGKYAFTNCAKLATVTLPEGLQTIGENAFEKCRALTHVTIPKSVTTIGKGAFVNCEKLANVTLPADAQLGTIGESAFSGCKRLTSINLPEGLKTIGEGAFAACFELSDLTIPKSVETIEEGVFYQCHALTNVTLPDDGKLTTIGKNAFFRCRSLTTLTIPKSVNTIGAQAFSECSALKSITIPNSVTTIGNGAFANCTALKSVTVLWNTPLTIPPGVFDGITPPTGVTLHVPGGTGEAYRGNAVWGKLTILVLNAR